MKLSNTVVSVIVIVAVLVSAYALGLLIRQARTGGSRVQAPADVNKPARPTAVASHGPDAERTKDTPEERAKTQKQRAQAIEKMNAMTPEQKQKFREQIRKQVGGRQPGKKVKGQGPAEGGGHKGDANTPGPPGNQTTTTPSAEKAGAESGKAGSG